MAKSSWVAVFHVSCNEEDTKIRIRAAFLNSVHEVVEVAMGIVIDEALHDDYCETDKYGRPHAEIVAIELYKFNDYGLTGLCTRYADRIEAIRADLGLDPCEEA